MAALDTPPPDDKDWTWVLGAPCPECGFDARAISGADVPRIVADVVSAFTDALAGDTAAQRPARTVWSPVEYACHVRDVCTLFAQRTTAMLESDDPQFANWDQDETAVAQRYWAQPPAQVRDELRNAAAEVSAVYAGVQPEQWSRPGRRSNGSVFTVDSLGRYLAHDLLHHVHDIRR